jgi:hypothetical protein
MAVEEVGARLSLKDRQRFSRDARGAAEDVERIGDEAQETARDLGKLERRAVRAGGAIGTAIGRGTGLALRGMDRLTRSAGRLALRMGTRGLLGATAAVGVGLPLLSKSLLNTAATLEATGNKARTVFAEELPAVTKWAEQSAAKMGLTANEATGLAASFADLLVPMGFSREQARGMSTDVVGLAGALSQWGGNKQSAAEVSEVLSKAMLGERDGLKALGISISEADVSARLAAKGQTKLTGAALQQAKAVATQELILAKSTDAQEAYAKGGLKIAGAQARIGAAFRTLKERAAAKFAPHIAAFLEDLLTRLPAVEAFLGRVGTSVQSFARDALPPIREGLLAFRDSLTEALAVFGTFGANSDNAKSAGQSFGETLRTVLGVVGQLVVKVAEVARWLYDNRTAVLQAVAASAVLRVTIAAARVGLVAYNVVAAIAAAMSRRKAAATAADTAATRANTVATRAGAAATRLATVAKRAFGLAVKAASSAAKVARVGFALMWAAATGPVGLVVLGIAAVVTAVVLLYRRFDSVRKVLDKVWSLVRKVVDKIRDMKLPSLPSWLGGGGDAPEGRASGGPVQARRPYLVGEQGPELIVPSAAGHVLTAPRTAALLGHVPASLDGGGAAGPPPVTVTIGTIVEAADPRRTMTAVRQAVRDELARR